MKRIAMLMTGRISDSWEFSYDSTLRFIIKELNPTIFVSTYYGDKSSLNNFITSYGIKHIVIKNFEADGEFYQKTNNKANNNYNWGSMFYHIKSAYKLLIDSGIEFDYIIKWRVDIVPYCKLPADIFDKIDDTTVIIPRTEGAYNGINPADYVNCKIILPNNRISAIDQKNSIGNMCPDHVIIGNMKTIGILANFDFIEYYKDFGIKIDQHNGPEQLIHNIFELNDIKWLFTDKIWFYSLKQVWDSTSHDYVIKNKECNENIQRQMNYYKKLMEQGIK
jgi:hypothetical protein